MNKRVSRVVIWLLILSLAIVSIGCRRTLQDENNLRTGEGDKVADEIAPTDAFQLTKENTYSVNQPIMMGGDATNSREITVTDISFVDDLTQIPNYDANRLSELANQDNGTIVLVTMKYINKRDSKLPESQKSFLTDKISFDPFTLYYERVIATEQDNRPSREAIYTDLIAGEGKYLDDAKMTFGLFELLPGKEAEARVAYRVSTEDLKAGQVYFRWERNGEYGKYDYLKLPQP